MSLANPGLIPSVSFHKYDESRVIAIEPDTASWAVVDAQGEEFLRSLDGSRSISSIAEGGPEKRELLDRAYAIGLIALGQDRRLPPDLFQRMPVHVQPWHAVLNITRNCNLKCVYCYARAGDDSQNMSPDMIYRVFQSYADGAWEPAETSDGRITMIMHGGEPLMALDEMREGVRRIRRHPKQERLEILLQTNGTMFTDEAVQFFREEHVGVGVSFDGIEWCHDRTRPFAHGKPSYAAVLRGIERLKEEGIGFGVLVVVTSITAPHVEQIFDDILARGIRSISFNRFFHGGRGKAVGAELAISDEQWYRVQRTLLERLIAVNRAEKDPANYVRIREFGHMLQNLLTKSRMWICMRSPCGAGWVHLAFMPDGSVYPCDRYIGEGEMVLGNLNDKSLSEILNGNPLLERILARRVDRVERCRMCDWRWVCGGDCPARVYLQNGTIDSAGVQCDSIRRITQDMIVMLDKGLLTPEYLILDD